jgi:hypothetical protein
MKVCVGMDLERAELRGCEAVRRHKRIDAVMPAGRQVEVGALWPITTRQRGC